MGSCNHRMETKMTTAILQRMPKKTLRASAVLTGLILASVLVNAIIIFADRIAG
jgi:hypothetical protein